MTTYKDSLARKLIDAMPDTVEKIKKQYLLDTEMDERILHPEVEMGCYDSIRDDIEKQYTWGCKGRNTCTRDYDGYISYDDEY